MSDRKDVDQLLKKVMLMETQQAFDFLKEADADEGVINQVAQMLQPSATRTAFLNERGLFAEVVNVQFDIDLSGTTIQNIKIIKPLGEGGMGTVYLAEDIHLQRKVAIKALHNSHQVSPKVQARFRREALILSKLDHPNICRIYNLIETEEADYLVLERIKGQTLKEYEGKHLPKSKKLDIAMALLEALGVAHSKGIIHRDLKPENIMIDGNNQVKVLDFGISRLSQHTQSNSSDKKEIAEKNQTIAGAVMGTLTYMSPEQAAGEELTTASDIYTLGLIFQELFSTTPVYADDLTAEQLLKLSTAAETQNPTDLSNDLTQLIQRMKSKSSAQRPTAIDALAILARIKSKPARRFKYGIATAVLFVFGLGVFKHINDLNHEREQAQLAQNQAEQVTDFLTSIFKVSNPYYQNAKNLTAYELLNNGAERIEIELIDQPQTQAFLKASIGNVFRQLGEQEKAKPLLEKAYEQIKNIPDANPTHKADIAISLGSLAMSNADYDEAKALYEEALSVMPKGFSKSYFSAQTNLAIYYSRTNQYEKAKLLNLQLIDSIQQHDPENIADLSSAYNSLGMVHFRMDQPKLAMPYFEQGLKLIESSQEPLLNEKSSMTANLALVKAQAGEQEEAIALSLETLSLREQIMPENHPDLILSYDNLAYAYYQADDTENAKLWNMKALDSYREVFKFSAGLTDQNRYDYAVTLANYGVFMRNEDKLPEAKETFTEVVDIMLEILGPEHRYVADYTYELGQIALLQGELDSAINHVDTALQVYQKIKQPLNSRHLKSWLLKADTLFQTQQTVALEKLKVELLKKLNAVDPLNQESIDLLNEKFIEFGVTLN